MKAKTLILREEGFNKDFFSICTVNETVTVGVKVGVCSNDITITLDQLQQLIDFTSKHLKKWKYQHTS